MILKSLSLSITSISILLICCEDSLTDFPENCCDTTSQDFFWQFDTIGLPGTVLNDVTVLAENDIWVCGEIVTSETGNLDSNGVIIPPANAAHWNGHDWQIESLWFRLDYLDTVIYTNAATIRTIFVNNEDEIWFISDLGAITLLQIDSWVPLEIPFGTGPGGTTAIWGTASDNLYFVGPNGKITYYNGSFWNRIPVNTTLDLTDIWGSLNGLNIWVTAFNQGVGTALIRLNSGNASIVYQDNEHLIDIRDDSLSTVLSSVWTNKNDSIYIVGPGGLYHLHSDSRGEANRNWFNADFAPGFPRRLRGRASNDLFVIGDFTFIAHYNGKTWRYFEEFRSGINLNSLAFYNNLTIIVGTDFESDKGIIIKAQRY